MKIKKGDTVEVISGKEILQRSIKNLRKKDPAELLRFQNRFLPQK
jgi:hypothetical protein